MDLEKIELKKTLYIWLYQYIFTVCNAFYYFWEQHMTTLNNVCDIVTHDKKVTILSIGGMRRDVYTCLVFS